MKITQVVEFDAGHRLMNHDGKCKNIHGHRYRAEITISFQGVFDEESGMFVDFAKLKAVIKDWIDKHLDHAMILNQNDELVKFCQGESSKYRCISGDPTAENIALLMRSGLRSQIMCSFPDTILEKIRLYETPNSWVEVSWVDGRVEVMH